MPVYEFECGKCQQVLEQSHPHTDIPDAVRCGCGGVARKILSRCGFNMPQREASDPMERLMDQRNRRMIENNADKIRSGELEIIGKTTRENEAVLPKKFH